MQKIPKGIRGLFLGRKQTRFFSKGGNWSIAPILGGRISLFFRKWNLSEIVIETDHHPVIHDHSPFRGRFNLEIDSKGIESIDLRTISIKSCVWIKLFREVASLIFLIPFKIDIKGRDVRIWGKFTVVTIAPLFLRTWNERSLEREREISGKIAAKFCPSTLRTSRQGKHSQGNPDCERESSARSGRARF